VDTKLLRLWKFACRSS